MDFSQLKSKELVRNTAVSKFLTARETRFIGIAVTATRGCILCTGLRIKKAIEIDKISDNAIYAVVDLAAAVNAGVTLAIASQGARNSVSLEFPQLHSDELLRRAEESEFLSDTERHLIGIAVASTRGCIAYTGRRIEEALTRDNMSSETIFAAIDVAAAVNAGVTVAIAGQGVKLDNAVEESEECPDGICTVGI
jgi:alkylhydroperoxidase/carboxymuconolactone decarboxylase family protein YurZ